MVSNQFQTPNNLLVLKMKNTILSSEWKNNILCENLFRLKNKI